MAILVAVMTVIIFGIAALVADLGQARVVRGEAQAASDASALAAGNALYLSGTDEANIPAAIAAAHDYAANNYDVTEADWTGCDDPSPLVYPAPETTYGAKSYSATECISFDDDTQPTVVRVVAPVRGVKLVFGAVFGITNVDISAQAQASIRLGGQANCGLCVVGSGYHDFQNGDAYISGGDISINGSVNIQNNGMVSTDGIISVEGTATGPLDGYEPDPLTGQEPILDPLANYDPQIDFTELTAKSDPCGTGSTHGPGLYGARNFGNDPCVLQPGIYVITGEWDFSGLASLDATSGVTLYFACGSTTAVSACHPPGQNGGWLDAGGNGNIHIVAPTTGPTAGLAIMYDRLNIRDLEISGAGTASYVGTIYALSSKLRYDGNGCSRSMESLIVVGNLEFNGNPACLRSDYVLEKNVYVPPDGLHLSK
ncbi:MAG: pilus assembly protein TadG-related protein [Nocardioides sp.]